MALPQFLSNLLQRSPQTVSTEEAMPNLGIEPRYLLDAEGTPTKGLLQVGNVDPWNRPILHNPDGSYSTTSSASFNFGDNRETLLPTVVNGRRLTDDEAVNYYKRTGEHLGQFDTPENADVYATNLHNEQQRRIGNEAGQAVIGGMPTNTIARPRFRRGI